MFDKKKYETVIVLINGIEVSFKLATSPSLILLPFPSNFKFHEQLRTLVMGLGGIDVILKLEIFE